MDLTHLLFDRGRHHGEFGFFAAKLVVVAIAEGLADHRPDIREELEACLVEHQAHRSLVDRLAVAIAIANEFHLGVAPDGEVEHDLAAIDESRQHGIRNFAIDFEQHIGHRRARRDPARDAAIDNIDL